MYQQVKGLAYRAWMAKADDDRGLARSALVSDQYPSMACYLTQQAMEKYMKAQLVSLGEVPERTHDLSLLLDHLYLASGEEPDLSIAADAGLLSSYEASTRYPGITFSTEDVTRAAGAYEAMAKSLRETGFEVPGWDDPERYVEVPPSAEEQR